MPPQVMPQNSTKMDVFTINKKALNLKRLFQARRGFVPLTNFGACIFPTMLQAAIYAGPSLPVYKPIVKVDSLYECQEYCAGVQHILVLRQHL
jgi:hypothetical protein